MRTMEYGVSLVELMVALLISTVLLLAVTQVVITNKLGYLFHTAQTDNQSNARFTLQWLDRQLARTGFKRRPDQSLTAAFPALSEAQSGVSGCSFEAGEVIRPLPGKALCLRYQPSDRQEVDCLGNGRPTNAASLARPYAEPAEPYVEKLSVNSSQQLICTSKDGAASLIEGIADVRFDFGIGLPDSSRATTYTASPASSDYIRSVRYAALLSAAAPDAALAKSATSWRYWNGPVRQAPRGRLYHVIKGTTALRNLLP